MLVFGIAQLLTLPAAANAASLPARIARVVSSSAVGGASVVYVWDQETRDVIYTKAASRAVTPASNMKLLTSAAALQHWGADHRFTTRIVATGAQQDGTWNGSIYLVGGGDPVLSTAGFARDNFHGYANATNIAGLATALRKLHITRIAGSLVVDDDRFDAQRYVREWPSRFRFDEAGALGALTVNESQLGKYIGGRSARYPDIQAGLQLRLALKRAGIAVTGMTRAGSAPDDATELAHVDSPRLLDIVNHMNAVSDNFVAETLLKGIGADAMGGVGGSTVAGRRAAARILKSFGVGVGGLTWTDGSGLAGSNRVTARLLGHVLGMGAQSAWGPDWIDGLATSGGTGTLRHRMTRQPYRGNVHAKTGTLRNSSALAGFADSVDGTHRYGFATVTYAPRGSISLSAAHTLQDRLAMTLVR
jgi:D-alanyl-D-alanine carboxypeptidase/D-alanyl-D-alanine-endopeptidase (penicillin-binding protein 4)